MLSDIEKADKENVPAKRFKKPTSKVAEVLEQADAQKAKKHGSKAKSK